MQSLFSIFFLILILPLITSDLIDKRIKDIQLDEKGVKNMKELHHNWYLYSLKAILGQLGKRLTKEISYGNSNALGLCLKKIKIVKDLSLSAKCLFDARQRHLLEHSLISLNRRRIPYRFPDKDKELWYKKRRAKRSPHRLIEPKFSQIKRLDKMPSLLSTDNKPVKTITNLFLNIFAQTNNTHNSETWIKTYANLLKMQKKIDKPKPEKSTMVYTKRMYDIVMEPPDSKDAQKMDFDLNGIMSFINKFAKISKNDNIRVLSPRIFPIVSDDKERKKFLSPAIFPMYKDSAEQQILPIPEILDKSGMDKSDRDTVLHMIMELSGARKTVESAMKVLNHMYSFGISNSLIEVSQNITKSFKSMKKSFNSVQKKDYKQSGISFLESDQIEKLHSEYGLDRYNTGFNITDYKQKTSSERWSALWNTVEELAYGKRRVKRQLAPDSTRNTIFPISVLSPVVLQPYAFAPVFGLSILGPVVLSPNIFSPLILNPSVLGPWVMSPSVPLPFILSPYLLSPYVLSPLVMAPFILTPYVLSPNVINPYILSPLVLSPLVLCPDVLSPMVLGGPILSPGVLSPSVLSKSVLMANVLSPTILS